MKIAATLIAYVKSDPEKELSALIDSMEAAKTDFYVVGIDSKSSPQTEGWLRERLGDRATLFPFGFDDDFSAARNLTLEHLPADADWFYWIDTDDTLEMRGGKTLPEYLSAVAPPVNAIFCDYEYDLDKFGNVQTVVSRHRLLRNSQKWVWRNRLHEDVHLADGSQIVGDETDEFVWVHHIDRPEGEHARSPERNFRILRKAIAEEPNNPRNWFYLGNQHYGMHEWKQAIDAFTTYLSKAGPNVEERWSALIFRAIAYRSLEMYPESIESDNAALMLQPLWADSYFGLGDAHARMGHWEEARVWGEMGLARTASGDGFAPKSVFMNANAYMFNPYMWLAVAYFNLGDNEKSLACYEQAAKQRPEPELLYQIDHMKAAMKRDAAIKAGLGLAAHLVRTNEPLKARAALQLLPAGAEDQNPLVPAAKVVVDRRLAHLQNDTAYRNFYFAEQVESIDALEALPHVKERYPRMHWVLERLLAAGVRKVLDLGVGNAVSSFYYAQHGIQVVGVDVDWRRVKAANFNAVKLGYLSAYRPQRKANGRERRTIVMDRDARAQFHCSSADGLTKQILDLGPYDAVVAAEIIEHVERPEDILEACEKVAKRVILSTPDGAYDGPQEENKGHVRAWSQRELVAFLAPRGKLVELHKVAHPNPVEQGNLVAEYLPAEENKGAPIVIWCPDTGQNWLPESIHKGGIGGSETAVIRVAEELARKGNRVTVYAECEGVWNGVRYAYTRNFQPHPCWLFVAWRALGPLPYMKEFAQHRYLWSHDVDFGEATPEQLDGVTLIALSEWHKGYLERKYEGAKILISGNGIDPGRFAREVERIPHRLIYAQSPDRGLDVVLRLFPRIRERYPDATLEVFYGFDLAKRIGKAKFIAEIEELAQQPGVTLHGRVDQDRLAEEYLKADALIYPATQPNGIPFYETYCISVVEAQAAGCIPITPDWGALSEVNKFGLIVMPTAELIDGLDIWEDPNGLDYFRKNGVEWAQQQTWEKVADGWLAPLIRREAAVA